MNFYLRNPMGESVRHFWEGVLLQALTLAKKMRLTLKMICCTFFL